MKRCGKIILLSLAGLLVVLAVALQVVLKSDFARTRLIEAVQGSVDADFDVSDVDLSLFGSFPLLEARLEGVSLTYPAERFGSVSRCSALRPYASFGIGDQTDTLLHADRIVLAINPFSLLGGNVDVPRTSVHGLRVYAHRYDSLASNWNTLRSSSASRSATADSSSLSLSAVRIGVLSVGHGSVLVLDDAVSGVSAMFDPGRVRLSGSVVSGRRGVSLERFSLDIDSLRTELVYGADTLCYDVFSLMAELTGRGSIGVSASTLACLDSPEVGELYVPLDLRGTLGYLSGLRGTEVSISGLALDLACFPFSVDGKLHFVDGGVGMDATIALADCPLDTVLHRYASVFYPSLSDFSTDAVLSADLDVEGSLGGGSLPELSLCIRIPDSRTVYAPRGSSLDLALDVDATLSASRVLNAEIHEFRAGIDGMDVSLGGSVMDFLGDDPLYRLSLKAMADMGSLARFVPDSLELTRSEGLLELDLNAATRQSNFSDFKFRNALIEGTLTAQNLSFALADTIGASVYNGMASLSSTPSGLSVQFGADSLYCNSGRNIMARIRDIHNSADISKIEYRGRTVPKMSVSTESDMIFLKLGNARYGVRGASVAASARRSVPAERRRRTPALGRRRPAMDMVRDIARQDIDFANADIDISLDSALVKYLRNWSFSGHLQADNGMMASRALPLRTRLTALHVDFNDNGIHLDTVGVRCGTSDFNMSGVVTGVKNSLMRKSRIGASLSLNSERINVNELVAASLIGQEDNASLAPDSELDESFVTDTLADASIDIDDLPLFIVPGNVDINVSVMADRVDFLEPKIGPFVSGIRMRDRTMQLTSTDIATEFGRIYADAFYSTKSKKDISTGINLNLEDMQVDRVIALVPFVDSLMPALKTFEGNVSCELSATACLDSLMNVVVPTLDGVMRVNGRNMKLYNEGQFGKMAGMMLFGKNDVMSIDNLSADAIIHDSRLEVFPFELGVDKFKLAMQGSQGFDKTMRYHVSVLKSPLLLRFGIDVYGTLDDWKISIGRARLTGGNIPIFTAQLDTVQLNLANSIRNIYARNVNDVVGFNRRTLMGLYDRKMHIDSVSDGDEHKDEVAREGYAEMFSNIVYERELEAIARQTMEEADEVLEDSFIDMSDLVRQNEYMMYDARTRRKIERMERREARREAREARRESRRNG